jgi:hypothetical protein
MSKFAVGEIAIVTGLAAWNGKEVEIIGPARYSHGWSYSRHRRESGYGHPVTAPWLPAVPNGWFFPLVNLRKRPPPPDWSAIAHAKDKPREVEPA